MGSCGVGSGPLWGKHYISPPLISCWVLALFNGLLSIYRNWLRSAFFLVIIMGITWIFGVLIVEVEELVPLAYIYTIMVAFQGLFIFFIVVVFSKQVREVYVKCWRRIKVRSSDFFSKYLSSNKYNSQK